MRKINVEEYNPFWAEKYRQEALLLKNVFSTQLLDIHHIGSTSVPGLRSKPVIDILIAVNEIQQVDKLDGLMERLGYAPRGENGISGRRFFIKGGNDRSHHVHVFESDSPEVIKHLAFRDYLRTHVKVRDEYAQLKRKLANQYQHDAEKYSEGKNAFIQCHTILALKEFTSR